MLIDMASCRVEEQDHSALCRVVPQPCHPRAVPHPCRWSCCPGAGVETTCQHRNGAGTLCSVLCSCWVGASVLLLLLGGSRHALLPWPVLCCLVGAGELLLSAGDLLLGVLLLSAVRCRELLPGWGRARTTWARTRTWARQHQDLGGKMGRGDLGERMARANLGLTRWRSRSGRGSAGRGEERPWRGGRRLIISLFLFRWMTAGWH